MKIGRVSQMQCSFPFCTAASIAQTGLFVFTTPRISYIHIDIYIYIVYRQLTWTGVMSHQHFQASAHNPGA